MEPISKNQSSILEINSQKYSSNEVNDEATTPSEYNGNVIAVVAAAIPIIVILVIVISFKISEKLCPAGQRRDVLSLPRRISMLSTFSTMSSRKNSSTHGSQSISISSLMSATRHHHPVPTSHLQLHHVHPLHHNQHITTRADGTPLLVTELETIRDQDEEEEQENEGDVHSQNIV